MAHPLVEQLRFARSELLRCIDGVSDEDALKRLMPMNCISWMLGHLANQENAYWVRVAQGVTLFPDLRGLVGHGMPASTPPLADMLAAWREITVAADTFLDTLTTADLTRHMEIKGKPVDESTGTLLRRNTYHYFFHCGEALAVRQMLGHADLPEFVGDMTAAIYRPE